MIAQFIAPGATVIDVGCGGQALLAYLPKGCRYQPCDIIRHTDNVWLCDFNKGVYPSCKEPFDYVVCSGTFEYARNPEGFLEAMCSLGCNLILSYSPLESGMSKVERMAQGWCNHLTQVEFEQLLVRGGMIGQASAKWKCHLIYLIRRAALCNK
jgi:hypothetical protein